jgi:quercetin dioxygenase-like cupin family protein
MALDTTDAKEQTMALIHHDDRERAHPYPGVTRRRIVDRDTGAGSLSISLVTIEPGAAVRTHLHKVEEAMLVVEGEGLAILGTERMPIKAGETLHAPAGIRHGFVNTGSAPMVVSGIFPAVDIEIFVVDEERSAGT